jgi:hypothetical protein
VEVGSNSSRSGTVAPGNVIADAIEITDGEFRPSKIHQLTLRVRETLVDHGQDLGMFDELASVSSCNAFLNFADEPLVISDEALDRLIDERFTVLSLRRRDSIQLSFEFGGELDLHPLILTHSFDIN